MTELEQLKELATSKGIEYHHRIGVDKLRAKIASYETEVDYAELQAQIIEPVSVNPAPPVFKPLTPKQKIMLRKKKASQLIRINIACMNPAKRSWKGDIFSVGSAQLGTFKKFVPFNTDYHVPRIIYNEIKAKTCSFFREVPSGVGNGNNITESFQGKEYTIALLDPLTPEQLNELAAQQAKAHSID